MNRCTPARMLHATCRCRKTPLWLQRATRVSRRKDMPIETKKRRGETININKADKHTYAG